MAFIIPYLSYISDHLYTLFYDISNLMLKLASLLLKTASIGYETKPEEASRVLCRYSKEFGISRLDGLIPAYLNILKDETQDH